MATYQTQVISLACDVSSKDNVLDQSTSAEPQCYWSADLTIRASLFSDDGITIQDVSDLQSATLNVKDPSNMDGSPLYQATITQFDNTTTTALWNAGTNQHMLFAIPADNLSFSLGGGTPPQRLLHLSLSVITTGGKTGVVAVGSLNVIDAGNLSPSSNPANAITVGQAQAMVAALAWTGNPLTLAAAGTTDVVNSQTWSLGQAPVTIAAGSGPFTASLTLDPANALTGAVLYLPVDLAASINGTLNIYDGTTAGALLQTLVQPDATETRSYLLICRFDGAHWHKMGGFWT